MSYAILGVRGLGGEATSSGVDKALLPYAKKDAWFRIIGYQSSGIKKAIEELKGFNGKIVILCFSLGWRVKKYLHELKDKDLYLISWDAAPIQLGRIPLESDLGPDRHLNIWQEIPFPQPFGRVEGAKNVQWHEPGHSRLDDREGVQKLTQEHIDAFLLEEAKENPMVEYKITPKIALEVAVHEGLVQQAYKDTKGIWTWSIGVTSLSGHRVERYIGNPQSIERCIEIYIWLLDTLYRPAIERAFQGAPLTEEQIAAALSFHWNTGGIERATWVKQWVRGDIAQARESFMKWRKPPEIIPRRRSERDLFFDGDWTGDGTVLHYQSVNGSGDPINAKRLDITGAVTEALEKHYGSRDLDIKKEPETILDANVAVILEEYDLLTPKDAQFIIAMRKHGQPDPLNPPPDMKTIEGELITHKPLTSPAKEPGSSFKGTGKMTFDFLKFSSKTFWVGAINVIAGVMFLIAPDSPISDLLRSFVGETEPGTLISMGLGIIFAREAIAKNGTGA